MTVFTVQTIRGVSMLREATSQRSPLIDFHSDVEQHLACYMHRSESGFRAKANKLML